MIKGKDKGSDVQFVYEEDDSKTLLENPAESISDDDLNGLEFAAATVVVENPLLKTSDENEELSSQYAESNSGENALEMSEEAKKQRTATVLHIDRSMLAKEKEGTKGNIIPVEKSDPQITISEQKKEPSITDKTDPTRDSIKPQTLIKTNPKIVAEKTIARQEPTSERIRPITRPIAQPTRSSIAGIEDESVIERIHQIETHAEVRIALAEFKAEFLAEHLGEAKALEYQIKQLLKPLAKTNNEAMIKQIKKIYGLLEEHSKGTIELVKGKAQAEKIVKPTQEKANKIIAETNLKKAS